MILIPLLPFLGFLVNASLGRYVSKMMAESKGKGRSPSKFVDVPAKYHAHETSGLRTTVNKGVNTYDIVIPK